MRDIFKEIDPWLASSTPFAVATVVNTWGSAPRRAGSGMAVTADLKVVGSVSGGCIEGAVIEAAQGILNGDPARELHFGVTDETAWSVGLTCGGKVSVYVEPHIAFDSRTTNQKIWPALHEALRTNCPLILATRLDNSANRHLLIYPDGQTIGDWGSDTAAAVDSAKLAYNDRKSLRTIIGEQPVFLHVMPRRDHMLIVGAAHISIPLVKFAHDMDFEVTVIDPRRIFATPERFTTPPDHLYDDWPNEILPKIELHDDTYAVLLTHDPKIDDVALHTLLRSDVHYITALGSKKTHAKRRARLLEAGFTDSEIDRIKGPAGLPIGAKTPDEIALSIVAEAIQFKRSRENS